MLDDEQPAHGAERSVRTAALTSGILAFPLVVNVFPFAWNCMLAPAAVQALSEPVMSSEYDDDDMVPVPQVAWLLATAVMLVTPAAPFTEP